MRVHNYSSGRGAAVQADRTSFPAERTEESPQSITACCHELRGIFLRNFLRKEFKEMKIHLTVFDWFFGFYSCRFIPLPLSEELSP